VCFHCDKFVHVSTVHRWATKLRLGQEKSWLQLVGTQMELSHGFLERGRTINGGVPYCITPKQEGLGSTSRTFCCNLTTLGLTPRERPWRQLRRWIAQSYRTLPYSPDLAPHDFHLSSETDGRPSWTPVGLEEVERSVRTWMKNPSVKFFRGGCWKLVHLCRKCLGVEW
jgi:hypothetical protein